MVPATVDSQKQISARHIPLILVDTITITNQTQEREVAKTYWKTYVQINVLLLAALNWHLVDIAASNFDYKTNGKCHM